MAQNKQWSAGPVALTASAANLLNPTITSFAGSTGFTITAIYILLKRVTVVNTTASAETCTFYIGATAGSAAGTEFLAKGTIVPANSSVTWAGLNRRMLAADFLTGLTSSVASNTLIVDFDFEIGVV